MREQMKEKFSELIKQREEFRKKDKEVKDKERALIALCKQEKPNYEVIFFNKKKRIIISKGNYQIFG